MSNFLAVASVTASLGQMLQDVVQNDVQGSVVTSVRPDGSESGTPERGVNVYLYHAMPNNGWRNSDLPSRDSGGSVVALPKAALNLHYLLTFYGDDNALEPQRLLGSVVRTLHTRPVLDRQLIRDTVANSPHLRESDLAEAIELVKFTPLQMSLAELSKLWSVFFQIQYRLSVTYEATVVLIDGLVTPRTALPVRDRGVSGGAFGQPVIERIRSAAGTHAPIELGGTVLIEGRDLRGDITRVSLGDMLASPPTDDVTPVGIRFPMDSPPFDAHRLLAGVHGVQVVHSMLLGKPPMEHWGVASNVAPVVLRPAVTDVEVLKPRTPDPQNEPKLRNAVVQVSLSPEVGLKQRVVMLLNEFDPPTDRPARAYVFHAPARGGDEEPLTRPDITIPVRGVHIGSYLVRVQVDGAGSVLAVDDVDGSPTHGQYAAPTVQFE